jgi:hypothetical protein
MTALLTTTAELLAEHRAHLSFDDFDQPPYASALRLPLLVAVDLFDTTVATGRRDNLPAPAPTSSRCSRRPAATTPDPGTSTRPATSRP